jgi:hypothetical protein
VDDDAIRAVVKRLSRKHPSGGRVIERAAVMAEGPDSAEILAWITAHEGRPEAAVASRPGRGRGLHSDRVDDAATARNTAPARFVLPAAELS